MVLWILIYAGLLFGYATPTLIGDHLCPVEERYFLNVTRNVLRKIKIRNYQWCLNVPPRCSYYTEEEKYFPEVMEQEQIRIINKCCSGYQEDKITKKCVPECNCLHGDCDQNNCNCHAGFSGHNCNAECTADRWGKNCVFSCLCDQGTCDSATGYCTCHPGWKGSRCAERIETEDSIDISQPNVEKTSEKLNQINNNRTEQPFLQKYHTFLIPTQNPSSTTKLPPNFDNLSNVSLKNDNFSIVSDNSKETSIQDARKNSSTPIIIRIGNNVTETNTEASDSVHVTNIKEEGTDNEVKVNVGEKWPNDDSENDLAILHNEAPVNDSHLVFTIGAMAGLTAIIIIIGAVSIWTAKGYKKKKKCAGVANFATNNRKENGLQALSIYATSIFHTPLPEPPTFETPTFTAPAEYQNNLNSEFGGTFKTRVICSILPNQKNYLDDSRTIESFYDHPPSTGSYRAASLPEPPERNSGMIKDHLYDEIPCWTQPLPKVSTTKSVILSPDNSLAFYANTTL